MAEIGAHSKSLDTHSEFDLDSPDTLQGTVLRPPARIASLWDGALRARLNREPLETFLRTYSQICSTSVPDPLCESIELACLFIVDPVLTHRVDWGALCHAEYFSAIGQTLVRVSRAISNVVQEPKAWRVAALRAMGRLLTPLLGLDTAASVAAASVATFGVSRKCFAEMDKTVEEHTANAVMKGCGDSLKEVRKLIREHLRSAAESGAAKLSTAPVMITISVGPPSNH